MSKAILLFMGVLLGCATATADPAQEDTLKIPETSRVYLFGEDVPDNVYLDLLPGTTVILSPGAHELLLLHKAAVDAAWDAVHSAQNDLDATIAQAVQTEKARADSLALVADAAQQEITALEAKIDEVKAALAALLAALGGGA